MARRFRNINQDIIIKKNEHPCMKDWKECRLIFNSLNIHTNTNIKRLDGNTQISIRTTHGLCQGLKEPLNLSLPERLQPLTLPSLLN